MTPRFQELAGLPTSGPLATAFPSEWGCLGREGKVVEFVTSAGSWVGNFQPGLDGLDLALLHPNGRDVLIIASGDLWVVDPDGRKAEHSLPALDALLEVRDPDGWIFSRQGLALARFGAAGMLWHTRRLSWDGIDELEIHGDAISGRAYSPMDEKWHPFTVDLRSGESSGGSYLAGESDEWETLSDGEVGV